MSNKKLKIPKNNVIESWKTNETLIYWLINNLFFNKFFLKLLIYEVIKIYAVNGSWMKLQGFFYNVMFTYFK